YSKLWIVRVIHAKKCIEQLLVCVHGSVKILLDDGTEAKTVLLDNPYEGLYVSNNMWREMSEFSEGAVLMVFASKYYDEDDYIRDYDEFLRFVGKNPE
ncbi:MAG: FdtA/QdtA family cupin domain-containing protein, partial [Lachnospiraceae bacterium]|nr:FdtA/QdtA family cupin domain-containing protein [Lachnospiraceae bacterium]